MAPRDARGRASSCSSEKRVRIARLHERLPSTTISSAFPSCTSYSIIDSPPVRLARFPTTLTAGEERFGGTDVTPAKQHDASRTLNLDINGA